MKCAMRLSWLVAASVGPWAAGDVSLPSLLSHGVVLQRETDASIYGFARPGEAVTVWGSWTKEGESRSQAVADERGMWKTSVSTRGAGPGPHTVEVKGNNAVTIRDVLVGEVWVCSGQSNMEWPLSESDDGDKFAAESNDPLLRMFTVPNTPSLHDRLDTIGAWTAATPESTARFSAVGYHFAKELRAALGVPVGVVSADWGGTRVEAWMPDVALKKFDSVAKELQAQATARDPLTRQRESASLDRAWWASFDTAGRPAVGNKWREDGFDDGNWTTGTLPGHFGGELEGFDGVVFYRRVLTLSAEQAAACKETAAALSLGPIDDRDETFVNGVIVGATYADGDWNTDRVYEIPPGTLREGPNTIALAVLDTAGPGGLFGEPEQLSLSMPGATPIPLAGEWRLRRGPAVTELPPQPRPVQVGPNSAGALYRGMVAPLTRHTISGVIWYQGESNRGNSSEYAALFPSMIESWRTAFAQPALQFHFVQIAPFTYTRDTGQTALLREAQAAALALENTGMVVTMDVGDPADIHPRNKEAIGRRLSRLALIGARAADGRSVDIGETNYPTLLRTVPLGRSALRAEFNIAPGELVVRGDELIGFEIAGEDKRFFPARAVLAGNGVEVSHPRVPSPVAVRYGFCSDCAPNLFSREDLPAAPFRTDTWSHGEWTIDQEDLLAKLRDDDRAFVPLIGSDLSGWINVNTFPTTWTSGQDEYGAPTIHCTGSPTGVLRTKGVYENFILELEWRHLSPRANAGLFVWSDPLTARGQPFTRSVEVQVMDGMEDSWYTSDGDVFPIHGAVMTPLTRPSGSRAMPTERRANPSPMWNHYRVECINGELSLAVNGKVVSRGKDISPRRGHICLESEGGPIDFRHMRIKVLPAASPALSTEQVCAPDEGFVSLLTSEDLQGWEVSETNKGHWRMTDWVLAYDGKGEHLRTSREFGNYELICDWRLPQKPRNEPVPIILPDGTHKTDEAGAQVTESIKNAGDTGIYLRGTERSQVNIWCWPIGSGELWDVRNDQSVAPEVRAAATPKARADAAPGDWNRFRIRLIGDRVTVDLNGQRVIEDAQIPGIPALGPILLQHHGEAVEFANIYVKELP